MSVHVKVLSGAYIVHPRFARLTATRGAREFRAALQKGINDGYQGIAIDFSGVEFADRAIMHVLTGAYKLHSQSYGLMFAFHCSDDLEEFFEQTLLDRLIPVVQDEEAALSVLAGCKKREPDEPVPRKLLEKAYAVGHRIGVLRDRRVVAVNIPPEHDRRAKRGPSQVAEVPPVEPARVAVQPEETPPPAEQALPAPPEEPAAPKKRPSKPRRREKAQQSAEDLVLPLGTEGEQKKPKASGRKRTTRAPRKKPEQGG